MSEENISQEFRLKNIDETRNFIEDMKQNEFMSKNHKKFCRVLNHIGSILILISTVTGCGSISAFASLVGILIEITSSAVELKICVITAGMKKYKSLIKKKNKHDKIVFLAKSKLSSIEVLISKALIHSIVSHAEFVLINNVLKEFYDVKEEIKIDNDK